jgi:hypothetical protein
VAPTPFTIAVEDSALGDLRRRLDATRWPDEIADSGWAFGTDLHYLKSLVDLLARRVQLARSRGGP